MNDDSSKPGVFARIGSGITRIRVILSNVIFFGLLLAVAVFLFAGVPTPQVPDKGALVLDPRGAIVEQRSTVDPIQQWLTPQAVLGETELNDLLDALENAREDERIALAVVDLDDLQFVSLAHASAIGEALRRFRETGKEVIAYGSAFEQQSYLIASYASAVYLHPLGQVMLPGYSLRQLYYKDLLDKLAINVHVFRAGKYKDFVEPYTRVDMSADSKQANQELIDGLWAYYGDRVRTNRHLDTTQFQRYTGGYDQAVAETGGDFARLAVEYGLVDELLTPDQARARVADVVGRDPDGDFTSIGFRDYLSAVGGGPADTDGGPQIGVITAQGPVMMGGEIRGAIAAERVVRMIRQARQDDDVAALVMRLDTPGGSAFASEVIRQELELTQLSGKPVVVSMGSAAASGGYWIASTADHIVAEPTTLTGSIGVFGILPSFEDSLSSVGIASDGVSTSELSPVNPIMGIDARTASVLQAGTEHMYQRFLNLVARGRAMDLDRVSEIAEGRVWLGARAQELGLVDSLGDEASAIAKAAGLAGVEAYGVRRLEIPLTPREMLLQQLTGVQALGWTTSWLEGSSEVPLFRQVGRAWELLRNLDDPRHSYALCLVCEVRGP